MRWGRVTLDFTRAMITASVPRINAEMAHGKLFIVGSPGIVIDTGGQLHVRQTSS